MLSSIHPFGERSRNSSWSVTVSAYLAGSLLGGATIGLAAGVLGQLVAGALTATGAMVVLGIACVAALLTDLGVGPLRRPSWHRQVNEVWLSTYRGWVYGFGFGFQLGLGVVTIVTTSLVWLFLLAALVLGSWWQGLVIGAAFGAVRGGLILATRGVHGPDQLRTLHRRIAAGAATIQRLALFTIAGAAVVTLSTLVLEPLTP